MLRLFAATVVVGVSAAVALFVATSSGGTKAPARSAYLAQARAICSEYSGKLDRIPPIQDPTLLGNVIESTNAALPILKEQSDRIRALTPPTALRTSVARFFALTDRSIDTLREVRDAARHLDSTRVGIGLIEFGKETTAAKVIGRRIGYRC